MATNLEIYERAQKHANDFQRMKYNILPERLQTPRKKKATPKNPYEDLALKVYNCYNNPPPEPEEAVMSKKVMEFQGDDSETDSVSVGGEHSFDPGTHPEIRRMNHPLGEFWRCNSDMNKFLLGSRYNSSRCLDYNIRPQDPNYISCTDPRKVNLNVNFRYKTKLHSVAKPPSRPEPVPILLTHRSINSPKRPRSALSGESSRKTIGTEGSGEKFAVAESDEKDDTFITSVPGEPGSENSIPGDVELPPEKEVTMNTDGQEAGPKLDTSNIVEVEKSEEFPSIEGGFSPRVQTAPMATLSPISKKKELKMEKSGEVGSKDNPHEGPLHLEYSQGLDNPVFNTKLVPVVATEEIDEPDDLPPEKFSMCFRALPPRHTPSTAFVYKEGLTRSRIRSFRTKPVLKAVSPHDSFSIPTEKQLEALENKRNELRMKLSRSLEASEHLKDSWMSELTAVEEKLETARTARSRPGSSRQGSARESSNGSVGRPASAKGRAPRRSFSKPNPLEINRERYFNEEGESDGEENEENSMTVRNVFVDRTSLKNMGVQGLKGGTVKRKGMKGSVRQAPTVEDSIHNPFRIGSPAYKAKRRELMGKQLMKVLTEQMAPYKQDISKLRDSIQSVTISEEESFEPPSIDTPTSLMANPEVREIFGLKKPRLVAQKADELRNKKLARGNPQQQKFRNSLHKQPLKQAQISVSFSDFGGWDE